MRKWAISSGKVFRHISGSGYRETLIIRLTKRKKCFAIAIFIIALIVDVLVWSQPLAGCTYESYDLVLDNMSIT